MSRAPHGDSSYQSLNVCCLCEAQSIQAASAFKIISRLVKIQDCYFNVLSLTIQQNPNAEITGEQLTLNLRAVLLRVRLSDVLDGGDREAASAHLISESRVAIQVSSPTIPL